jgi:hypothetical protein
MGLTHSPDPVHLLDGAGTAVFQTAYPRMYASGDGIGWGATPAGNATNADSGMPGQYRQPDNPIPPANVAQANDWGLISDYPTTTWVDGAWINTADGKPMYWDGAQWVAGKAPTVVVPNASGATAGAPGTWTPAGALVPFNTAEITTWGVVASPATAWTTGQHVVTGDYGSAHWNGTAWVDLVAP